MVMAAERAKVAAPVVSGVAVDVVDLDRFDPEALRGADPAMRLKAQHAGPNLPPYLAVPAHGGARPRAIIGAATLPVALIGANARPGQLSAAAADSWRCIRQGEFSDG